LVKVAHPECLDAATLPEETSFRELTRDRAWLFAKRPSACDRQRFMSLRVHHLNNSRSQRVLWLLEELGVSYEVTRYARDPETLLAPPELRSVHPLGKSPVVTDGDRTLAESGAILEYLVQRYGDGRFIPPEGTADRLRYTYWLHYAEGSAMPPLLLKLVFDRIEAARMPFFVKPFARMIARRAKDSFILPQLTTHLAFMEGELEKSPWFAGPEITAADVQMSYPIEAARSRAGITKASHPRLHAFLEHVHARPAYQRAIETGGPYDFARD
jgi:glutathione S-transferase